MLTCTTCSSSWKASTRLAGAPSKTWWVAFSSTLPELTCKIQFDSYDIKKIHLTPGVRKDLYNRYGLNHGFLRGAWCGARWDWWWSAGTRSNGHRAHGRGVYHWAEPLTTFYRVVPGYHKRERRNAGTPESPGWIGSCRRSDWHGIAFYLIYGTWKVTTKPVIPLLTPSESSSPSN